MGLACIHCGADCGKHPIMWDDKAFCCHGCKTVYQILNEKNLDKYYEIQPMSGIKIDQQDLGSTYAFLDNEEIIGQILEFSDGGIGKIELFIPAIHCASCIWLLENLHTIHPGIIQSHVNFPKKKVSITFKEKELSVRQVVEMLASIHYVPEITMDRLDRKEESHTDRDVLLKIGVAGFSFMNVMLYNFPEYLPGGDQLEQLFIDVFGWMSFLLALPVVFYSAKDYYLSAFKGLTHGQVNIDLPITLGIFTLFAQSSYDIFNGHGIGYMDSLVGLVFFLLIGKLYQGKTYQALSFERNYKSYFPVAVTRITEGKEETITLARLKKGDHILIRNQELIPADALLLKGNAHIDYAFVTGESIPVAKKKDELIYAGGRQVGSTIECIIIKEVAQSYLTQLWNQDRSKPAYDLSLNQLLNKVSKYFTGIIILIATGAAAYWMIFDAEKALFAFTSVLIIACPCALALTVPFTFGSTMRVFGRAGFYIKNTAVIEKLHQIKTIVFDKTGTITMSRKARVSFIGESLSMEEMQMIKSLVSHSSHPLSQIVKESIHTDQLIDVEHYQEIPAMGIRGDLKGVRINIGSESFVKGSAALGEARGGSSVFVYINGRVKGYYKIENQYRDGLSKVIRSLKTSFGLYVLSGDNEAEKETLQQIFGPETPLRFNQSPTEKMEFIGQLKKDGRPVLMIGDGLNDAGALMESDVGLTIADDIYSFSPACDGIIESAKFEKLHQFIHFTTYSMRVVRFSFVLSFSYNIIGLFFAVQGTLSPLIAAILMPISSVSIVAFVTFSVSALAKRKLR